MSSPSSAPAPFTTWQLFRSSPKAVLIRGHFDVYVSEDGNTFHEVGRKVLTEQHWSNDTQVAAALRFDDPITGEVKQLIQVNDVVVIGPDVYHQSTLAHGVEDFTLVPLEEHIVVTHDFHVSNSNERFILTNRQRQPDDNAVRLFHTSGSVRDNIVAEVHVAFSRVRDDGSVIVETSRGTLTVPPAEEQRHYGQTIWWTEPLRSGQTTPERLELTATDGALAALAPAELLLQRSGVDVGSPAHLGSGITNSAGGVAGDAGAGAGSSASSGSGSGSGSGVRTASTPGGSIGLQLP